MYCNWGLKGIRDRWTEQKSYFLCKKKYLFYFWCYSFIQYNIYIIAIPFVYIILYIILYDPFDPCDEIILTSLRTLGTSSSKRQRGGGDDRVNVKMTDAQKFDTSRKSAVCD